jgi:hypothetical protein
VVGPARTRVQLRTDVIFNAVFAVAFAALGIVSIRRGEPGWGWAWLALAVGNLIVAAINWRRRRAAAGPTAAGASSSPG